MLNMSFTDVDKEVEPVAKNTQMSKYEELTTKLMEKVNKDLVDDNKDVVKKYCKNSYCFPQFVLNERGKTVGTFDEDVGQSKKFLFPGLLDRAWVQLEDYNVRMFDSVLMVQDKVVSVHAVHRDLVQDGINALEDKFLFSGESIWNNLFHLSFQLQNYDFCRLFGG